MDCAQNQPPNQSGQWNRKRYYESVPQYNEPTRTVVQPTYCLEHFQSPFFPHPPRYGPVQNGAANSRTTRKAISNYLKDNRYNLFATLPLLAAGLEVWLLAYFFLTYVSLPGDPETGALVRLTPAYSTWPFISCIGGVRKAAYKTFAFLVAGLYQSGSSINLYLLWNKRSGYWVRRAGAVAGLTSSVLLVFLVFSSGTKETPTRLLITAAKILATLGVKTSIFVCDYLDRKAQPILTTIPTAIILRRWKEVIAALSYLFGTLVYASIYTCANEVQIQTPGTLCFKMMAVAAPAEWIMSLLWINFMLNMSYDFYTTPHISAVLKAAGGTESSNTSPASTSPTSPERLWRPAAEVFALHETPFLGEANHPGKTLASWKEHFELDKAPFVREAELPAKRMNSVSTVDDLDLESLALREMLASRGFV